MKDADVSDKKDILIAALEERYGAMRVIRERIQSVCIWALGLMIAAAGWLMQDDSIDPGRKPVYIIGLSIAFWVLRFKYLEDLRLGFIAQQRVAVRLEKALGLYTPGTFDESEDSVYPQKWEHAGSVQGDGKYLFSTYLLLYVGVGILAAAILLQGTSTNAKNDQCEKHLLPIELA